MKVHPSNSQLFFAAVNILVVSACVLITSTSGKTLTVQSGHNLSKRSPQVLTYDHVEEVSRLLQDHLEEDTHEPEIQRRKRDVKSAGPPTTPKNIPAPKVTHLEDSHNQLVVYWAGLDVIVCLAKDSKPGLPSTLYVSKDYGSNFENVSDQLYIGEGSAKKLPTLDKFFNHPKNNGHFIFTDVQNKYIFTTSNYGASFNKSKVDFIPEEVTFDPNSDHTILSYEKSTANRQLWVSQDFGATWKLVQTHVKSVAWDESVVPTNLYIGREEPGLLVTVVSSLSIFLDPADTRIILSDIEEFEVKDEYIFATRKTANENLELLVSYKRGEFLPALFPNQLPTKHFHIADVSDGQIFVVVIHNESVSNLYVGNEPLDTSEPPKFSLSLERIVFFKPSLTWTDSWLNDVTDEPFVELHHVEGLRGVYIASQLKSSTISSSKFGLDQVTSVITYDQGAQWRSLEAPQVDNDGEPIYCRLAASVTKTNCSLHISQRLNELYPQSRAVPILSQKSAVGIVMATGTVDSTLKGHLGVFMSTDGALSWKQVRQGNYLYNFGDHGGIIVAVRYYKIGDLTNTLLYSTDEGTTWHTYEFYKAPIRVLGLMTEPGENTTVFFIFGSDKSKSSFSWVLIKVDLKEAFERKCEAADYKKWSPSEAREGKHCLLGRTDVYTRRQSHVNCYNGVDFERVLSTKVCLCGRSDFECDFGYVEDLTDSSLKCVRDLSEDNPGVKAEWCAPGTVYYSRTKGYRKVPGDLCVDGDSALYLPETIPCAVKNEAEFMLVAKRDSVLRINLNEFSRVEILPLGKVRGVIAMDFSLKNNCIFWSDVNSDHIMKLHLDGKSSPEVLVSQDLKSVEGLAFDWLSQNLYFCDGTNKKIEVIRTDVSTFGRMRKLILGPKILDKPRGIAVHPVKGYIYYTDWSTDNPCIGRSDLDGSNAEKIVQNSASEGGSATALIKWPNGITVDVQNDKIYWVDANVDKMFTANLDGKQLEVFLADDARILHPFGVGVYKNLVYWDDWTTKSIYATRNDISSPKQGIITIHRNISRSMDLKVYGVNSQTGYNSCYANKNCPHLCLASTNNTFTCACPDGLLASGNDCLCPDGKVTVNGKCESKTCDDVNSFRCRSGFCVMSHWKCDGDDDCGDNSDEADCESQKPCAHNQFQCNTSRRCVPEHWRCDFDLDCPDGSDEVGCDGRETRCTSEDHFQCKNMQMCISNKFVCDGDNDCSDGSDEVNCTQKSAKCGVEEYHQRSTVEQKVDIQQFSRSPPSSILRTVNEFQCEEDQRCLAEAWKCDGDRDCLDGSDEANCTGSPCPSWKFSCGSGECIMMNWMCDADNDCKDKSDEANCTNTVVVTPPPNPFLSGNCSHMDQMFQCHTSNSCVPAFWRCDGVPDCPDQTDELNCQDDIESTPKTVTVAPPTKACPEDHFQCSSGDCIFEVAICDSVLDCPAGEDELNCHDYFHGCPVDHVQCGMSKICIQKSKVCNGIFDCPNRADEELMCSINITDTSHNCNIGQFSCDEGECHPLFQKCNKETNCLDGSDETYELCRDAKPYYQVAGISVDREDEISRERVLIEWWVHQSLNDVDSLEFLPSYCDTVMNLCQNATHWMKDRKYEVGSENKTLALRPFSKYSVTVYVRKDGTVYTPGVHKSFTTAEAEPSAPYNVTAYQPDVNNLCVRWNKPLFANGVILEYKVFFTPPIPPVSVTTSNVEQYCIANNKANPDFLSGTNYTFWVTARNSYRTSNESKLISYVFNEDVVRVTGSSVKDSSNTSVTLQWTVSGTDVEKYEITYEVAGSAYPFQNKTTTTTTSVTINGLPPGMKFKYSIIAVHKNVYGIPLTGYFSTKGESLPRVKNLIVSLSRKGKGNIVTVNWVAPKDDRITEWKYGVFYGKSIREIANNRTRVESTKTSAILQNLEACEEYFIDVGVIGPFGIGPMNSPKQILTGMDVTAPPKDLRIRTTDDLLKLVLTWKAPCPVLDKPIGYNVVVRETKLNHPFASSDVAYTKNASVEFPIKIQYGGHYEVTVSTNATGARPSAPASYDGPEISPPTQLQECTQCDVLTLFWEPPQLPAAVTAKGNVTYDVCLSDNEEFTNPTCFNTNGLSYRFSEAYNEKVYFAAVSVRDAHGLESRLSSHIPLQHFQNADSQIKLTTSNALGIVITVILVIGLLAGALAVFIVRHKRLQASFLNFASSHYSTSSGAATFQQSMEEEQDAPIIRGFSDDEPLLVA